MDESRAVVLQSAAYLLQAVRADPPTLERLVRGERRGLRQLRPHERAIATAHRILLVELCDAGYDWAVEDELQGLCSAVFGEDGYDPELIFELAADSLLHHPAA
ncbi:MAG TPA: hypothetical protein VGR90_02710 [Acidimicrobiales bacterium]|nr:hypothetical protein [Acidimicrobiales bacterium]